MLGATLAPAMRSRQDYEVITHGFSRRADVQADITDLSQCAALIESVKPDVVVNLAAQTNVDECEKKPDEAFRRNALPLRNLVETLQGSSAYLLHISTDQLYDGCGPHCENDIQLKNYYAYSKYCAELISLGRENGSVLRTNFFGPSMVDYKKSFTDWVLDSLINKKKMTLFTDVQFSPLSMETLSQTIIAFIDKNIRGLYNVGSHGGRSKAQFILDFAAAMELPIFNYSEGLSTDAALAAYRPKDMRMNLQKIEEALGSKMPQLDEEIRLVCKIYKNEINKVGN